MEFVYILISFIISLLALMTSVVLMDTVYYVLDYLFIWSMQFCIITSLLSWIALLVLMDTFHKLYYITYRPMTTQASFLSLVSELD